jgi:hypothetical protein
VTGKSGYGYFNPSLNNIYPSLKYKSYVKLTF